MFDVALSQAGSIISVATSCDKNHPPEHCIDGQSETFWVTTGLFPQELVVSFQSRMTLTNVQITSYNVKQLSLYKSTDSDVSECEKIDERELDQVEGQLQKEEFHLSNVSANHLKLVIQAGYDHFATIHRLHVQGSAAR